MEHRDDQVSLSRYRPLIRKGVVNGRHFQQHATVLRECEWPCVQHGTCLQVAEVKLVPCGIDRPWSGPGLEVVRIGSPTGADPEIDGFQHVVLRLPYPEVEREHGNELVRDDATELVSTAEELD